ncbi:hypothetical protein SteCoe_25742 [Stentor coeruleus]|uniref:TNFR-Cys domain-containing protein n=1 Tax=Stentor coeruleus TaxID=5963 RepID=A0A1R2BEJ8_9CILI|nr:hypothetical protein SteCoe_25742 [Stentor coeruleus]
MMMTILLIELVKGSIIQTASVSADNYSIRSTASITFSMILVNTIPDKGKIFILFPDDFSSPNTALCTVIYGASFPSNTICSFGSKNFNISNCFPSKDNTITFALYSIPTPLYSGKTKSFEIYTLTSTDSVIDYISSGLTIEFFPVSLKTASLIPSISIVNTFSSWTLSFSSNYEIPGLYIEFPIWNLNLNPPKAYEKSYCENITCNAINSIFYIDYIISFTCSCSNNILYIPGSSPGGEVYIQLEMQTPPITGQITDFYITSGKSLEYTIETLEIIVQIDTPGNITFSFIPDDSVIKYQTNYLLLFNCSSPVSASSELIINFTSGIISLSSSIIGIYGLNFFPDYIIKEDSIIITQSFIDYIPENTEFALRLLDVINPNTLGIGYIELFITTSDGNKVCQGEFSLDFSPLWIDTIVSLSSFKINEEISFSFEFDTDLFSLESSMIITFPNSFAFTQRISCTGQIICEFSFPEVFIWEINSTKVDIEGVLNPGTTEKTDFFVIKLFEDDNFVYEVAENREIYVQPESGVLNCSVYSISDVVGNDTEYAFSISLENEVYGDAVLMISFPSQVGFGSESRCYEIVGLSPQAYCIFVPPIVIVKSGFVDGFISSFNIKMSGLINPNSTCSSDSFQIQTYQGSYIIDNLISNTIIKLSTPGDLICDITGTSYTVGEISSYTFYITSTNNIPSTLKIQFPNDFTLINPICSKISSFLISLSCTLQNNNEISISLIMSIKSKIIVFTISNIQNPLMLISKSSLEVKTYDKFCEVDMGYGEIIIQRPGDLIVNINSSTNILGYTSDMFFTVQFTNPIPLGGKLRIDFPSWLLISENTYCNYECNIIKNSIILNPISNFTIYNIKNQDKSTGIGLEVYTISPNGLLIDYKISYDIEVICTDNCLDCETYGDICTECLPELILYNSSCISQCPIGTGIINNTCTQCDILCKSCETSPNICSECYEGFSYKGSCTLSCPLNTTIIFMDIKCIDCDSNCLTCLDDFTNCTSCNFGFNLYYNQCLETCPLGFGDVNGICEECPCTEDLLNNGQCDNLCDVESCNYDNGECKTSVSIKNMPSITAAAGSAVVSTASRAFGKGEIVGSTLALWGLTQSCSWIAIAYSLYKDDRGRRLVEATMKNAVAGMFLTILVVKLVLNIIFTVVYFCKFVRKDYVHYEWIKKHKIWVTIVGIMSGIFSFQLIRLTYTGPSFLSCCKGQFFRLSTVYILLLIYSIISLIFILFPVISLLAYVLFEYSSSQSIFAQALDCMLLTILISIGTVYDIATLSIEIGKETQSQNQNTIAPMRNLETKFAEETKYDEEIIDKKIYNLQNTARDEKETQKGEQLEPENEYSEQNAEPSLKIGDVIESNNGFDLASATPDNCDQEIFTVYHKPSGKNVVVKVEQCLIGADSGIDLVGGTILNIEISRSVSIRKDDSKLGKL